MNIDEINKEKIWADKELMKYVNRYEQTLSRVNYFLKNSKKLLFKCKKKLNIFYQQIQKNFNSNKRNISVDPYTDQIVIALYLRMILEIMLSRFIGNNDKLLKEKIDNKNGRYRKLIEILENTNTDIIKICKIIYHINDKKKNLELIPFEFWSENNLTDVYDELSYQYLHFSHELHENYKYICGQSIKDSLHQIYEKCLYSYKYLLKNYKLIFNTLQNHGSFVKVDVNFKEYIFEIENFKVKNVYLLFKNY